MDAALGNRLPRGLLIVPEVEIRTTKICEALNSIGIRATVAAEKWTHRNWDDRLKYLQGVDISICSSPSLPTQLWWNPLRDRRIARLLSSNEFDFVYARDMFMGAVALRLMNHRNYSLSRPKLVVDIADDNVAVLRQTRVLSKRVYSFLIRPLSVEQQVCRNADYLWFVSEFSLRHTANRHGEDIAARSFVVRNVPSGPLSEEPIPRDADRSRHIVYVGTIDAGIRDFEVICAVDRYLDREIYVDCYTFGVNSNPYVRYLTQRAARLRYLRLTFSEAVNNTDYARILDKYRVGLIPHCRNEITDNTVPNKLYDYTNRGLVVLASDNPALVEEVERLRCGITYRAGDPEDLAKKMLRALEQSRESSEHANDEYFGEICSSALRWLQDMERDG